MYLGTAFVELHRDKLYSVEFDMYLRFSDLQQLETLCSVTLSLLTVHWGETTKYSRAAHVDTCGFWREFCDELPLQLADNERSSVLLLPLGVSFPPCMFASPGILQKVFLAAWCKLP